MNAQEAREMAYYQAKRIDFRPGEQPFHTFSTIKLSIPNTQFVDQESVARQNLVLDPQGCLGRVAVIAAIMEKCHPSYELELGEVWDDYLKNILLQKLRNDPCLADDPTFMQELLMYEEPHAVVVVENQQVEPLSLELGEIIRHPKIESFPLWEGLAASSTVSEAWLKNDPAQKMVLLKHAEELCPGLTLVRENMAEAFELQGLITEAIECVRWCLERRPCARTLLVMNLLSKDERFYDKLVEIYTEKIVDYILGGDENG